MEQLEKVVNGLDLCCSVLSCCENECPYFDDPECNKNIKEDALTLIRKRIKELDAAQTARVMTLEEVENALDTVVWVEEPGFENSADYYALIMAYSHKTGFVRVYFGFAKMPVAWVYKYEDYGKKWRCWTQRPTDEQRTSNIMGMTHQEAIETIKAYYPDESHTMLREALDIAMDAIKAQEPVQVGEKVEGFCEAPEFYSCGFCKNAIRKPWSYCPFCGKLVKWDAVH